MHLYEKHIASHALQGVLRANIFLFWAHHYIFKLLNVPSFASVLLCTNAKHRTQHHSTVTSRLSLLVNNLNLLVTPRLLQLPHVLLPVVIPS